MSSATQRTIRELESIGRKCAMVEKWNPFVKRSDGKCGVRQDLFGIIDIIALDPKRGVVGVQCCSGGFSAHYKKIIGKMFQETLDWLETPGTALEIWSWRKVKVKRGGKAMVWRPKIVEITLDDLR